MAVMYPPSSPSTTSRATPSARCSTRCATGSPTSGRCSTPSAGSRATRPRARWTARSTSSSAIPTRAILCLEVKGGGDRVPRTASGSRSATASGQRMKDPFTQALDHRYDLRAPDRRVDGWRRQASCCIVHARRLPGRHRPRARARARRARARSSSTATTCEDVAARDRARPRLPPRRAREAQAAGRRRARRCCATCSCRRSIAPRADGRGVPRRGGGADPPDERAGAAARTACARNPRHGGHRLRRLGQDDARGRAREAPCRAGKRRPLRLLQPRARRAPAGPRGQRAASTFHTFHGLCARLGEQGRDQAPAVRRRRGAARATSTRSCPTRSSTRSASSARSTTR